jgi:hypothetical protein
MSFLLGEADVMRVIQMLPAIQAANEYFTVTYNSPDHFCKSLEVTGKISYGTIIDRLALREMSSIENELKLQEVYYPDSPIKRSN